MFESLFRSWDIVKKSFGVLMSEKRLLIFPFLSMLVMLVLLASFIVPVFVLGDNVLFIPLLFVFYFASYFVVIFFNSALVHAASEKLDGKDVSLSGSISFSLSRIVNIAGWAFVSATVGIILSMLRSASNKNSGIGGLVTRIVISLIGAAWSFATFLVVPVLVFENVGPISALKRSVSLLKSTWSEQMWGNFSISGAFFLLYLPAIGIGILLAALQEFTLLLLLLPALILYVGVLFILQGALEGIFMTEIYKYATTGKAAVFGDVLQQGKIS